MRTTRSASRAAALPSFKTQDLGCNAEQAQALADEIYRIPTETEWKVIAETANAQAQLDRFVNINSGRQIALTGVFTADNRIRNQAGVPVAQKDRGVVDYFAQGEFARENHVAEIARAGAMRVWAEPETGGEAYIPLAPSKRGRSIGICRETGRRLGVERFADGGFHEGGSGGMPPNNVYEAVSARATRRLRSARSSRLGEPDGPDQRT